MVVLVNGAQASIAISTSPIPPEHGEDPAHGKVPMPLNDLASLQVQ